MQEKEVERKLVAGVKQLGGIAYKFVSPGNAGVPDRLVLLPDGRVVFVELKTVTGKLSAIQRRQIARIAEHGGQVQVIYGAAGVKAFLERYAEELAREELSYAARHKLRDAKRGDAI